MAEQLAQTNQPADEVPAPSAEEGELDPWSATSAASGTDTRDAGTVSSNIFLEAGAASAASGTDTRDAGTVSSNFCSSSRFAAGEDAHGAGAASYGTFGPGSHPAPAEEFTRDSKKIQFIFYWRPGQPVLPSPGPVTSNSTSAPPASPAPEDQTPAGHMPPRRVPQASDRVRLRYFYRRIHRNRPVEQMSDQPMMPDQPMPAQAEQAAELLRDN
ncbi:hypothetical protein QE152_g23239 [Popillia japonica]|uniref:Uncharacterized protein n=1 Tax=Popillia japonica TaxID=7064 RepID=A0AAW1KHR8_POPJA